LSLGALFLHAHYYLPFLSDDSLISARYASRLLQGKGLTWTDGAPVEGYSNLLWTLLIALVGACGVDLIHAARLLGFAAMSAVVISTVWWYSRQYRPSEILLPLALGLVFFCGAAPIAVWTIGGLEQPLLAALLAVAIPLTLAVMESEGPRPGTTLALSLVLGLLCLTRLDSPIFTLAALVSIVLGRRLRARPLLPREVVWLLVFPCTFCAGQAVFRFWYYGEFVPNTALVKISPSLHRLGEGIVYVAGGVVALAPLSLAAIVGIAALIWRRPTRPRGILLLVFAAFWLSYVAFIGRDMFPTRRHFVQVAVIFMFAIIESGAEVWPRIRCMSRLRRWASYGLALALCCAFVWVQFVHWDGKEAITDRWEWDGKELGLALKHAFGKQRPLVAVTASGCIPYWSELPALDLLGVNDYYLPRHPPPSMGEGPVGHELGDAAYVLRKKPDIIVFNIGGLLAFRCGLQFARMPRFFDEYAAVHCRVPSSPKYDWILWVRKRSPKIGIRKTANEVRIPGFLFKGVSGTCPTFNARGELIIPVSAGHAAKLDLPPDLYSSYLYGRWILEIRGSNPDQVQASATPEGERPGLLLTSSSTAPVEVKEVVMSR
jgi:hypothetical protein